MPPSTVTLSPDTPADRASAKTHPGSVLQRLIDVAPPGVLVLPAGEYVMQDSLRLRSGVYVRGNHRVCLRRSAPLEARLTQITGYGHRELIVEDASAWAPGMGIAVTDSRSGGFGAIVATIVARDGNALFIDRPVGRDFHPANQARIRNTFPLVAGYGVEHAGFDGVRIEGDGAPASLDGCRDAGVYLIGCRDVRISDVEITRYPGDALSFQQCVDTYIDHCHVHHNAGHGLHPGSGSVRYVMRQNRVESNGGCGIFYCLRTSHSLCEGNTIAANGAEGVSIGERDTDHLIENNIIRDNAATGILFRPPVHSGGDRTVVVRNRVLNNAAKSGGPQIGVSAGTNDVLISLNWITGTTDSPRVVVGACCRNVCVAQNDDPTGSAVSPAIVSDSPLVAAIELSAGPAALGPAGARHLGVETLETWVDRTGSLSQEQA
jgi:hypothetical protein